jgi:hypothetical protein
MIKRKGVEQPHAFIGTNTTGHYDGNYEQDGLKRSAWFHL